MSSITTDSIKFHEEIKRRLTNDFGSEWTPVWNYCEMTQLLIYGFSFTLLSKEGQQTHKLVYRNWNNENLSRMVAGTFNLNLIRINEEEILVSLSQVFEIQKLTTREIGLIEWKGIVLDGYHKEFTDYKNNDKLIWNLDEEMNPNLSILTNKIRALKN